MNIAVIGAGAIGSVVAAYLSKAGQKVTLIGRPGQVEVIEKHGLTVKGTRGEENIALNVAPCLKTPCDLAIFTVKTQDLEEAYQQNNECLENAYVLSTQNGVQADNILSSHFERDKMYSSIVMFGATYTKPGEVVFNFEGDWIIGKPFMPVEPKVHELADLFKNAFSIVISNDIMGMKWLKLFVNFNNCIPALIGRSMQETFADMDMCLLSIQLLKEGVDVVRKANIDLVSLPHFPVDRIEGLAHMPPMQAAGIINKTLTTLSKEPLYGSVLQSIMRQRPSEIEFINGEVNHLATQMRTNAPLNEMVVAMVHQVEQTGKYFELDEVKKEFNLSKQGAK